MRMLQEHCDIKLTFQRGETASMEEDEQQDFLQWFNLMSEGYERDFSWGSPFPPQSFSNKSLTQKEHFISTYCVEGETNLKDCLLVANVGEEISKLSTLFITSNQYTKNIFLNVNKWEDLVKYSSPCTDIIIVDKYLLTNQELYSSNLYSIIKALCSHSTQTRLNIVIFTLKEVYDKKSKISFAPDWDKIYQAIRKCVGKRVPNPNVTFVTASDDKLEEHDRTIFTNYKTFSSGDSYNYFNSIGDHITDGRYLHAHSIVDNDNEVAAMKFLADMQAIINELIRLNPRFILKDQVSNFLTFS